MSLNYFSFPLSHGSVVILSKSVSFNKDKVFREWLSSFSLLGSALLDQVAALKSRGSASMGQASTEQVFVGQVLFVRKAGPLVGEGNGTPLQYACLENPMDGGAWWAAVYGVAQSRTGLNRLSSSSSKQERGAVNQSPGPGWSNEWPGLWPSIPGHHGVCMKRESFFPLQFNFIYFLNWKYNGFTMLY